jgi:DNA invertase Pin-like site-specific DNA recombinase
MAHVARRLLLAAQETLAKVGGWLRTYVSGVERAWGPDPTVVVLENQRPGLDAVMKMVARREVDMVAAWSVDRIGRSLIDLLDFLRELHAKGVDLFLHQQGLDTSTPSGRAMFQMMGVFAEFERAMIRERVLAGIARARDQGTQLGRRRLEDTDAKKVAASAATAIRHFSELLIAVRIALRLTPLKSGPCPSNQLGALYWYPAVPPGGSGRSGAMRPVNSMTAVALPGWRPSPRRRQCQSFIRG